MKKILLGCFLALASMSGSFALTIDDLEGSYTIHHDDENIAITYELVVLKNADMDIFMVMEDYLVDCSGKIEMLENSTVELRGTCENGMSVYFKANLSGVTDFVKFSAPVYSSVVGREMLLHFNRIEFRVQPL